MQHTDYGTVLMYCTLHACIDEQRRVIIQAMQHWEENTCIRFRPKDIGDIYYVKILSGSG